MKQKEIDRLHAYKLARANAVYTNEYGEAFIGLPDGRVKRYVPVEEIVQITAPTSTAPTPSTDVTSITDDGNGVIVVDNTDPQDPVITFAGVNTDGTSITGDGTSGNPLVATPTPLAAHAVTHTNGTDDIQLATASQKGLLSSTDWNTFNNKQNTPTVSAKTTAFTLALVDNNSIIKINSTSNVAVTVPPNSSVAFPNGTMIWFVQIDTGLPVITPGVGVTVQTPYTSYYSTRAQWSIISLIKIDTDLWVVGDDLGLSLDSDAIAFFNAVTALGGSFTVPEKVLMNNFFLAGKADGWWAKTHYCHLYVGGTLTTIKLNIKNPLDTNAAFRLTAVNSPTINSNGVTFNGSTQYLNTNYNVLTNASQNDKAYAIYLRSSGAGANMGAVTAGTFAGDYLIANAGGGTSWGLSRGGVGATAHANGFFLLNRTSSSSSNYKFNDVVVNSDAGATTANSSISMFIGCYNYGGGPAQYSADNVCFDWAGTSLTTGEATSLYNACQALQTGLGR